MDIFTAKKHALKRVDCVFVILSAANKPLRHGIVTPSGQSTKIGRCIRRGLFWLA